MASTGAVPVTIDVDRMGLANRRARIEAADAYLAARTGCYEWRCQRYDAALAAMYTVGLDDDCTVLDVGSGWGEFGVRLHAGAPQPGSVARGWTNPYGAPSLPPSRARYIPVDAGNDGTDLETWFPPRRVDYVVALEVIEHVRRPARLLAKLASAATRAVIITTPNPETTDVLGMDATHRSIVGRWQLEAHGFHVEARSFYGEPDDSLFAVLRK